MEVLWNGVEIRLREKNNYFGHEKRSKHQEKWLIYYLDHWRRFQLFL